MVGFEAGGDSGHGMSGRTGNAGESGSCSLGGSPAALDDPRTAGVFRAVCLPSLRLGGNTVIIRRP